MIQTTQYESKLIFDLKVMHRRKIEEMQKIIDSLTDEIEMIQKSKNRIYDL